MTDEARRRRHRNERIVAAVVVLIVAVAVGYIWWLSKKTEEEILSQMYVPQATTWTPDLLMLQAYLRIDTSNPPGNELPAAKFLAAILETGGVKAEIIESAPNRANVYARIRGRKSGEGLLLLHHMDVFPATPQGWTRPPFSGELHFNQIYGRGALDMKGTGIAQLQAFLKVARTKKQPERDVVFLAVADEETGGRLGMQWLIQNRPDVIEGVRYALNEGGITEMQQERVTYYGIEIGTKQSVTVMLHAPTKDSLRRTRIALEPWFIRREPDRVLPEVKTFLRSLAPQRIEFREQLSDIDRTIAQGGFWELPIGYRELTQNGVWAEAVTARPGGFQMKVLLLNLPDEDPEARLRWLESRIRPFGVTIGEVVAREGPAPLSPSDTPLFVLLAEQARVSFGNPPVGTEILNRSSNDSRFLRKRGIVAYGISPFPVDFFQAETIHGLDERVRADYFQMGVQFLQTVVSRHAFGG